jgi:hypothetical protein
MAMIGRIDTEGNGGATRVAEHASWMKSGPVVSHLPDDDIAILEEHAVITVADASALGLFGFATGTWMVATVMGGMLPADALIATAPVLLIFAGLGQFIAGLYSYRRANAMAGTAFCCFGAFNVTVALSLILQAAKILPTIPAASLLQGFLLESFGFIALALTIAAMRANIALVAVLGTLCVGYVLSGIPHLSDPAASGPSAIGRIGAWFLIASAILAFYTGMALVVNSTWKQTLFPLGD